MPYDPNLPLENTDIDAAEMRGQLQGLKDLIDGVPTLNAAVIDSVTPLPPGSAPTVGVVVGGQTMHFSFSLPVGIDSAVIDSVTTLPPGSAPTVGVVVSGNTLHFAFSLPQGIDSAVIDSVTTLPPGQPVSVSLGVSGTVLHFSFAIPQGAEGAPGLTGPPGEVTNLALTAAIGGTSANSNGVALLGLTVSDPPSQVEMQAVANKLDELIGALRRL